MPEFPETFRKAIISLNHRSALIDRASHVRIFSPDGKSLNSSTLQSSRVFRRMFRDSREMNRTVDNTLHALEHEGIERDRTLRQEAQELLPAHVRNRMSGILPDRSTAPFQTAYASFVDGISVEGVSPHTHLNGSSMDEQIGQIVDVVDEAYRIASDGLTYAINSQPLSSVMGLLCEQRGRAFGLSPLNYDGADLFPKIIRPLSSPHPIISIMNPAIEEGRFSSPDMTSTKKIFFNLGRMFANGSDTPEALGRNASQSLLAEFSRHLMTIPEDYDIRVSYSAEVMELTRRAQEAVKNGSSLADEPPRKYDESNITQDTLLDIAKAEARKAADVLKISQGNLVVIFDEISATQDIANEAIPAKANFIPNDHSNFIINDSTAAHDHEKGYGHNHEPS